MLLAGASTKRSAWIQGSLVLVDVATQYEVSSIASIRAARPKHCPLPHNSPQYRCDAKSSSTFW
jgi:hypothetical protein